SLSISKLSGSLTSPNGFAGLLLFVAFGSVTSFGRNIVASAVKVLPAGLLVVTLPVKAKVTSHPLGKSNIDVKVPSAAFQVIAVVVPQPSPSNVGVNPSGSNPEGTVKVNGAPSTSLGPLLRTLTV